MEDGNTNHIDDAINSFIFEGEVPFDDYSIPFRKDVLLNLIPGSRKPHDYREGASYDPDHPGEPVLQTGGDADCDSMEIVFPTVLEVEGEYRMWYCAGQGAEDF